MKYRYFYQTSANENRDGWISAKNRAEAYAALRKQGIRPYRLVGDDPVRWQPWAIGGLIALLVMALAVTVLVLRGGKDEAPVRRGQLIGDSAVVSEGLACGWSNLFANRLDQALAAYAQPGWIAMPPTLEDDELAEAVRTIEAPVALAVTAEAPEHRQLVRIVELMRTEMRDYLAAGGTARDYLAFLESRQDEEIAFRNQALDSVRRTPDPLRDRARINMNLRLREMGLLEIAE